MPFSCFLGILTFLLFFCGFSANGTKSTWDEYTWQRTENINAITNIQYRIRAARGEWQTEIRNHFNHMFYLESSVREMGLHWEGSGDRVESQQALAQEAYTFGGLVAGYRGWSGFLNELPPFSWSGVFSQSEADKRLAVMDLKQDAQLLFKMENARSRCPDIGVLLDDCAEIFTLSVRAVIAAYERDSYRSSSLSGRKTLAGLIYTMPDNTLVERAQAVPRDLARTARHMVSTNAGIYNSIINADIGKSCKVKTGNITKERFLERYKRRVPGMAKLFRSRSVKPPQSWLEIMKPGRDWSSKTPESFHSTVAAWMWLKHWDNLPTESRPRIGDAWQSKVAPKLQIIANTAGDATPRLCLGS